MGYFLKTYLLFFLVTKTVDVALPVHRTVCVVSDVKSEVNGRGSPW